MDEVDEQFLSDYSWGPSCQYYLLSRAMFGFLLALIGINILGGMFGQALEEEAASIDLVWTLLLVTLLLGGAFGLMAYAGKVARRRRWNMLNWSDFDSFRRSELMWKRLGAIGWAANILGVLAGLVEGISEGLKQGLKY